MGGGGSQDQTTRTEPWSGQQPYLRDIFGQAQQLYGQGPQQYFPGQTVAPFSPQQQLAMDLQTQMALGGDPNLQAAQQWGMGQMGMPQMDPRQIAQFGTGMQQQGADFLQQAGGAGPGFGEAAGMFGVGSDIGLPGAAQFAGGVTSPYTGALMGSSGYGGLGEASQFFGQPEAGALPAAQQFAGSMMQQPGQTIDPAAAAQLGQTAGGGFLGSNPYLDQLYETGAGRIQEQFEEQVLPGLAAQFGAAGRTGSGAQALATGRAAGDVAGELAGLYGDIYAPAYEAERGRQIQAATGLGELGIGTGQLGLGAGGLAGELYGAQAGAEAQRLGQAADYALGERGLGQQAMQAAGQLGLGGGELASQLYGTGVGAELGRLGMAGDIYGGGLDRQLQAGLGLGQIGAQGMGGLTDLFGQIGQQGFRAASLQPGMSAQRYSDIDRLMQVGAITQEQAQNLINADIERFNFGQQAPFANLGQYANIIQGLPAGYGTTTASGPERSRFQGALGGAMTGASLGSVIPGLGTGIGAGIGGLLGLFG